MSETDVTKTSESKFPVVRLVRSEWSYSGRRSREAAQSPGGHINFVDLHSRDGVSSSGPDREAGLKPAFPSQRALKDSPTRRLLNLRWLWLSAWLRPLWRSHRRQGTAPFPSPLRFPAVFTGSSGGKGRWRWQALGGRKSKPIHLRHRFQQQYNFQMGDVVAIQAEGRTGEN